MTTTTELFKSVVVFASLSALNYINCIFDFCKINLTYKKNTTSHDGRVLVWSLCYLVLLVQAVPSPEHVRNQDKMILVPASGCS